MKNDDRRLREHFKVGGGKGNKILLTFEDESAELKTSVSAHKEVQRRGSRWFSWLGVCLPLGL